MNYRRSLARPLGNVQSFLKKNRGQKGVAIIGFALVASLLFATVFMILAVGRMFYVEGVVKASLNDTLRTAEGEIDLWVRDPKGGDAQTFEKALKQINNSYLASGPTDLERTSSFGTSASGLPG